MYKCKYCGRYLKKEYETCPGCNSKEFEKIEQFGPKVITEIPKTGFKINLKNIKKEANIQIIGNLIFTAVVFSPILLFIYINFSIMGIEKSNLFDIPILEGIIIPLIFGGIIYLIIGKVFIKNIIKFIKEKNLKIKNLEKLSTTGVLIKNLEYKIKMSDKGYQKCIEVEYTTSSGEKIALLSEGKFNEILVSKNGTADLLIDPNDTTNYFIDFEIY